MGGSGLILRSDLTLEAWADSKRIAGIRLKPNEARSLASMLMATAEEYEAASQPKPAPASLIAGGLGGELKCEFRNRI